MARAKKHRTMSFSAISSLPAAMGMAVLSSTGRGLAWTIMRAIKAPISSAIVTSMTLGIAFAASNALYMQTALHPAPLFAEQPLTTASVTPVRTTKVHSNQRVAVPNRYQQVAPAQAPKPAMPEAVAKIHQQDVMALQRKLSALGFFDGKSDGFYGPQTADAIRAFETSIRRNPVGALTPELLRAVNKASPKVMPKSSADPLMQIVQNVAAIAQKDISPNRSAIGEEMVRKVQRGLYSLGFLQGKIDGIAGESTAKAIRQFEVYYNYDVTGAVTLELVDMLVGAGAKG